MNKIAKVSLLALGAAMVTQAVHAQYNDGDMLLGFTSSSHDYVIDLGQIPTVAGTQLGGAISLSTYNSTFGTGATAVGVIGGDQSNLIAYGTTLRTGTSPFSSGVAGTETKPTRLTDASIDTIVPFPGGIPQGATAASDGTTAGPFWSQQISTGVGAAGSDLSSWGQFQKPMVSLASQPVTLDYWSTEDNGNGLETWTYLGDLTVDMTGASPSVIWDPVAVPEPATYGLLAGGGLLALALRRQFVRKNA